MSRFEHSMDVNVPISTAYNQWTQFEDFPNFMPSIRSLRQKTDKTLHWEAEIAGRRQAWDAEITEQKPDSRIAWRSTSGAKNSGVVTFHYLNQSMTRIMILVEYEPEGVLEKVGSALGVVSHRMEADMRAFKEHIERRGFESGAWRGEINQHAAPSAFGNRYSEPSASVPDEPQPAGQTTERNERNDLGDNSFSSPENPDSAREGASDAMDNWNTSTTPTEVATPQHEDLGNSDIAPGDDPAHSFGAVEDEPQGRWDEESVPHPQKS